MSAITRVDAADSVAAITTLRNDGVVAIDGLLSPEAIDDLRESILARHPEFADKALLTDFQNNGEGRLIAPVAISSAVHASGLLQSAALRALAEGGGWDRIG